MGLGKFVPFLFLRQFQKPQNGRPSSFMQKNKICFLSIRHACDCNPESGSGHKTEVVGGSLWNLTREIFILLCLRVFSDMWKSLHLFFFVFTVGGLGNGKVLKCLPVCRPRRGSVSCSLEGGPSGCENPVVGSVAQFRCEAFYRLEGEGTLSCLDNGTWTSTPPSCTPDCGQRNSAVALIVNGILGIRGAFPWHVAIYNLVDGNYEYWCGGSLISESAVLTAAHCTWKISPSKLILAFGKVHRKFYSDESNVQKIRAEKILMLDTYQDVGGNYNGDLSVILLAKPVEIGSYVKPVCIDWDQKLTMKHLEVGTLGMVPGWGLTEADVFSDTLRATQLPVIADEKCIEEQQRDFRKFVTYTTFCAGFTNGTGVCNGDSGGGLVFLDRKSGRWYIQGIVSVSPRRSGTPYCDLHFYTVFTKVGPFTAWLRSATEIDKEMSKSRGKKTKKCQTNDRHNWRLATDENLYRFVLKYFNASEVTVGRRKLAFPLSRQILDSSRLIAK